MLLGRVVIGYSEYRGVQREVNKQSKRCRV